MFHEALARDLKKIFEVKKVLFASPKLEKEKSFYCVVEHSRLKNLVGGKAVADVIGNIGMIGQNKENPSFYFFRKIEKADKNILKRFYFSNIENNIDIDYSGQNFNGFFIKFVYYYRSEYDTNRNKILDFITNIF